MPSSGLVAYLHSNKMNENLIHHKIMNKNKKVPDLKMKRSRQHK